MYIRVIVKTNSKKELFEKVNKNTFNISVREEAKNNWANQKVIEILKEKLKVKRIILVSGHHNPIKLFRIEN